MAEKIEAIVFDLGGVLVELTGIATMLSWSNLALDEQTLWQRWLHSPAVRDFETGKIEPQVFAGHIVKEMQLCVTAKEFLESFAGWPSGLFSGVPALLSSLRQNFTLACLSNTNTLHWPRLMDEMKLGEYLDHMFASHLLGKIKPDADIFAHLIDDLALPPERILFFDDNIINVDSAVAHGIQAIHVRGFADVDSYLKAENLTAKIK